MNSKVALVTGAGRRLGAEIARHLGRHNFRVLVHVNASLSEGSAVVDEIERDGGRASLIQADLTTIQGIDRVVSEIKKTFDGLDVLVNSASIFKYDRPGAASVDTLEQSLKIHIVAPFALMEELAQLATATRRLDVFNILDQKLESLNPDYYSYTIGKAGLNAITKLWQSADRPHVRAFGILPGNLYPSGRQTEEDFRAAGRANLLQRSPTPSDICEAISFFQSHPGIPGQNIAIDSGERLVGRARDPAYDAEITHQ
jgi:NAD(P)-dependent dehydrogenase (short-subunit alcohol dehydrogenase family)